MIYRGEKSLMILGVDFGDSRTGYAVSDALGFSANTLEVYAEKNINKVAQHTAELAKNLGAEKIVLGFPKNMNGTEGPRAELCRAFADTLREATGLEVVMWDERRTTVEAHNILSQHNYHGKKRKNTVDAVAASLILEGYLAFRGR